MVDPPSVRMVFFFRRFLYLGFLFTLAARGLEEPLNFQELLTKSVGRVHFS